PKAHLNAAARLKCACSTSLYQKIPIPILLMIYSSISMLNDTTSLNPKKKRREKPIFPKAVLAFARPHLGNDKAGVSTMMKTGRWPFMALNRSNILNLSVMRTLITFKFFAQVELGLYDNIFFRNTISAIDIGLS